MNTNYDVADRIDLDEIFDYKAEYSKLVDGLEIHGTNGTGRCPFHADTHSSLSINFKTGQWHCFAENESGNYVSFWAKLFGTDTKTAFKEICEKHGVACEPKDSGDAPCLSSYDMSQYAADKNLPEAFLTGICLVTTATTQDGRTTYLRIPYLMEDYKVATYRMRYGHKEFRWSRGSSGKICLYGLWRLPDMRKEGRLILVEGESDTQTLWYLGFPALGVPGASMFRPEYADSLDATTLYIHQEPDQGGETFVHKVREGLRKHGFHGTVYRWSCREFGAKDPSDLYLQLGRELATEKIKYALENAEEIDLNEEQIPESIPDDPIQLRQADGWLVSDDGVKLLDKNGRAELVCRTPLLLTKRVKSIKAGDEKIEVSFKRDGRWHSFIYPRSIVFSSRSITVLAESGATITSENARSMVRFLGALEAENIDLIPVVEATSSFGWQPGERFMPGKAEDIILDVDPSQRGLAAAYEQSGSLEGWIAHMAPPRENARFRFILAASFAAPLLRILKQRIFFVYNWGGSRSGKTAALKAALSAWGDPERLMVNFNATQVALERMAAFFCDLPLGIDERQLAGNSQEALEKLVYMISSGTGKVRGAKTGGLQTIHTWRTIALATGEEPLSTDTSQTGVSTRVLEIYGAPFSTESDAGLMHRQSAEDHGWAGPAFIRRIVSVDEQMIRDAFEQMYAFIHESTGGKNGSHLSCVATVALADAMIDSWLFGDVLAEKPPSDASDPLQHLGIDDKSWENAKQMARQILIEQMESNSGDVNANAVQYIIDWVNSNAASFGEKAFGACYGFFSEACDLVYVFPTALKNALARGGYNYQKTMRYMEEQDLISVTRDRNGKKLSSVVRWFQGKSSRFVELRLSKAEQVLSGGVEDETNPDPEP